MGTRLDPQTQVPTGPQSLAYCKEKGSPLQTLLVTANARWEGERDTGRTGEDRGRVWGSGDMSQGLLGLANSSSNWKASEVSEKERDLPSGSKCLCDPPQGHFATVIPRDKHWKSSASPSSSGTFQVMNLHPSIARHCLRSSQDMDGKLRVPWPTHQTWRVGKVPSRVDVLSCGCGWSADSSALQVLPILVAFVSLDQKHFLFGWF